MSKCYEAAFEVERDINNSKKIYLSFSGGKDSTAMLLRLLELGERIDEIVFADTGFEFPELYEYIDMIEKYINRPITRLNQGEDLWKKWFYGEVTRGKKEGKVRGMPMFTQPCWYSRESKIVPMQKHYVDAEKVYVGIAYDEQHRCGKDDFIKYPLVEWGWTEQDCVDYLNEKKIMNPLYKNYNRLGCFFCQKQSEQSLWVLWKTNKDLWEKTKFWDKESIRVSGHGIKIKTMEEYEKEFEDGKIPKKLPKYHCESCDAVGSAFAMRQEKLKHYFSNKYSKKGEHK